MIDYTHPARHANTGRSCHTCGGAGFYVPRRYHRALACPCTPAAPAAPAPAPLVLRRGDVVTLTGPRAGSVTRSA